MRTLNIAVLLSVLAPSAFAIPKMTEDSARVYCVERLHPPAWVTPNSIFESAFQECISRAKNGDAQPIIINNPRLLSLSREEVAKQTCATAVPGWARTPFGDFVKCPAAPSK